MGADLSRAPSKEHRCLDILMTGEYLDRSDVVPALEYVSGKGYAGSCARRHRRTPTPPGQAPPIRSQRWAGEYGGGGQGGGRRSSRRDRR